MMVWDTASATSSDLGSSCCVGMTSVPGKPIDMKCHESLCYVAAGSSVIAVDLRTMQNVVTGAVHRTKIRSFAAVPSKYLLCTGGYDDRALLWDIRRNHGLLKPEPLAELEGHKYSVTKLYMDPYKIVTCGSHDSHVKVWEAGTGELTNSLPCSDSCNALAVDGYRIATAAYDVLRFRDFNNATCPAMKLEID